MLWITYAKNLLQLMKMMSVQKYSFSVMDFLKYFFNKGYAHKYVLSLSVGELEELQ